MVRVETTGDLRVDQIMPVLCSSWAIKLFEECLQDRIGRYKKLKKKDIKPTGRIPVVDQGEKFIAGYVDNADDAYKGSLPVIIFGDHTRRIKFIDFSFAVGADGTKILKPIDELSPKFFYYYLGSLNLESQGYSRHYRFLKQTKIPIPSLAEQRRIVAKLEKLLSKVDACKERLEKIPAILKRFRQSVLAAATSGKLTGDLASDRAVSENSSIQLTKVLSEVVTGPFGSSLHKADYVTGGIPVVNPMHINRGAITPSPEMAVSLKKAEQLSDFGLRAGDVVIARRGTMGRCAVAKPNQQGWLCGTGSMVLRTTPELMSEYLQVFLSSPETIKALEADAVGSTMVNLNQRIMLALPIQLPSVSEQHEIVRRVEALFKIADDIEKRYEKAKAHVDKLTQSILAKAFRGELVPQDPNDEPASELLKRIQEERRKQEAESRPGRWDSKCGVKSHKADGRTSL